MSANPITPDPAITADADTRPGAPKIVNTPAEAQALIVRLSEAAARLEDVLMRETEAVKASRISQIGALQEEKTGAIRAYLAEFTTLKANAAFVKQALPQEVETLKQNHQRFEAEVQHNLTSLEAVRAANQGLVQAIFEIVRERRGGPTIYSGNAVMAGADPNRPSALVVDRAL